MPSTLWVRLGKTRFIQDKSVKPKWDNWGNIAEYFSPPASRIGVSKLQFLTIKERAAKLSQFLGKSWCVGSSNKWRRVRALSIWNFVCRTAYSVYFVRYLIQRNFIVLFLKTRIESYFTIKHSYQSSGILMSVDFARYYICAYENN